ncbi:TPA: hypothetical protein PBP03_004226 [Escherichia coli]|nr:MULTISPECIES: hypothetical protein [Enterobacteriaceae]EHP3098054.1 hypothetical protein [Escherichia coli]EIM2516854.1 hypothetical protein [Escherichia coli]EIY0246370.1 hypothetical protein [Escherichia coli]EJN0083783.1 hypothetical protein [Escherichia coli]EKD7855526.1 hypothetical protein [Escherichia coli]
MFSKLVQSSIKAMF